MEKESVAAVCLLFDILSERGEKVKENGLEELALWARQRGKLSRPSLVFCEAEWKDVGEILRDSVSVGRTDKKLAQ